MRIVSCLCFALAIWCITSLRQACATSVTAVAIVVQFRCPTDGTDTFFCPNVGEPIIIPSQESMSGNCAQWDGTRYSYTMGVRIEIPAVTWSAAYSNYNLADIYVSEDLMNTTSNLRYLAMPWINFCDIANAANDIGVDKEFASLTFPSSGSGCSAFKTKAVGGVPYNE